MRKPFDIKITQDGVKIADDQEHFSHLNWDSFYQLRESTSLFLLYFSPSLPLCLPKRLIPASELPFVQQLIMSPITSTQSNKKV